MNVDLAARQRELLLEEFPATRAQADRSKFEMYFEFNRHMR